MLTRAAPPPEPITVSTSVFAAALRSAMLLDMEPVLSSASAISSGFVLETPLEVAREVTLNCIRDWPISFETMVGIDPVIVT